MSDKDLKRNKKSWKEIISTPRVIYTLIVCSYMPLYVIIKKIAYSSEWWTSVILDNYSIWQIMSVFYFISLLGPPVLQIIYNLTHSRDLLDSFKECSLYSIPIAVGGLINLIDASLPIAISGIIAFPFAMLIIYLPALIIGRIRHSEYS